PRANSHGLPRADLLAWLPVRIQQFQWLDHRFASTRLCGDASVGGSFRTDRLIFLICDQGVVIIEDFLRLPIEYHSTAVQENGPVAKDLDCRGIVRGNKQSGAGVSKLADTLY